METCGADFTRIKIGIGVPQDNNENANIDWVLGRPTEAEEAILSELMPKIAEGIKVWINEGPEKAMTLFNTQMKSDNG
ncbi:MAG: hypothetical protein NTY09_03540, partial [bacterium]|nr:hypothetical protein [bacterium]